MVLTPAKRMHCHFQPQQQLSWKRAARGGGAGSGDGRSSTATAAPPTPRHRDKNRSSPDKVEQDLNPITPHISMFLRSQKISPARQRLKSFSFCGASPKDRISRNFRPTLYSRRRSSFVYQFWGRHSRSYKLPPDIDENKRDKQGRGLWENSI